MRALRWLPIALPGALLALAGSGLLFSTFMMYDDEGYVLFSLKQFSEGGGLYERVYSQYGPFFFLFNQALHLVGLEFDNIGARLLTFVFWFGGTGFCAATVWRVTRSTAATAFTFGGVFLHLWPMISEPSHPGGLIVFATAATAWLGAGWVRQPRRLALTAGIAGGALLLTKINIGIFLVAGAGAWWALHLDEDRLGLRRRTMLVGAAMVLLPFALMRGQIALPWVGTFVIIAAAAGAATVLAAGRGAEPITHWRNAADGVLAGTAVFGLTCAGILAQGTSLGGLFEGVFLGPLRHPQAYTAFVKWRLGADALAVVSLAVAAWLVARPSPAGNRVVAWGRLIAAGIFLSCWALNRPLNTHAFALSYSLSLIWLFVYPLGGPNESQPVRAWLALLVATQALHAFPVAGSQISWGTFLWIPLAAIGVFEAVPVLTAGWPAGGLVARRVAAAVVILTITARSAEYASLGTSRVRQGDNLGLPGAAVLRLPESFTTMLRVLARNISAHADMLFSLPGMHSFHLWTDVPPPTTINATHWFTLLSPAQQEAIRARLAAAPQSVVIVQRNIYDFLLNSGVATESPLTVWLRANYEPVLTLETYEFWVRKGRHIALLSTATAREASPGITPRYQVALILGEPKLQDVATIEFARFADDVTAPVQAWTNANAQLFVTPINSAGADAGPARPLRFPFEAGGFIRLELRTDQLPATLPQDGVFFLRNSAGERVAEARLVK